MGLGARRCALGGVGDLVRARRAASQNFRRNRRQLLLFLLRHRLIGGPQHWSQVHLRWLAQQRFDHPAQRIAFQNAEDVIEDAMTRLRPIECRYGIKSPKRSSGSARRSDSSMLSANSLSADSANWRGPSARSRATLRARRAGRPPQPKSLPG